MACRVRAGEARQNGSDDHDHPGPGDAPTSTRLPTRARRAARRQRDGGHPVPRRGVVDARRVPRCRGVLRRLGLPHHRAAARGAQRHRRDRPAPVLDPSSPSTAAGALPAARRGLGRLPAGLAGRRRADGRRRARSADLRQQLVADPARRVLLRRRAGGRRCCCTCGPSRSRSSSTSSSRRCSCSAARRPSAGSGPATVIAVLAVASAVWMAILYQPFEDTTRVYYGTDTRAAGLLVGVVLAMVWAPWRSRSRAVAGRRPGPRRDRCRGTGRHRLVPGPGERLRRVHLPRRDVPAGPRVHRRDRRAGAPRDAAVAGDGAGPRWCGSASGRTRSTCGTGRSSR